MVCTSPILPKYRGALERDTKAVAGGEGSQCPRWGQLSRLLLLVGSRRHLEW